VAKPKDCTSLQVERRTETSSSTIATSAGAALACATGASLVRRAFLRMAALDHAHDGGG
jgi:hypothetical protein